MAISKENHRTDISDIEKNEAGLHVLDSQDKIIRWIKYQHEEQKIQDHDSFIAGFQYYIDLSNCFISITNSNGIIKPFFLTDLKDTVKVSEKISGQKNVKCEVFQKIRCENSIIYGCFFDNTRFHKQIVFSNTKIYSNGGFKFCEFMDSFLIYNSNIFIDGFSHSTFYDRFILENSSLSQCGFVGCLFKGEVIFNRISFHQNIPQTKNCIDFDFSIFEQKLTISHLNTNINCYFYSCTFKKDVELSNIMACNKTISFNESTFSRKLSLLYRTIEIPTLNSITQLCLNRANVAEISIKDSRISVLNAQAMILQPNGFFQLKNNTINMCDLTSLYNQGTLFIENNKISSIKLANSVNLGFVEVENTPIDINNVSDQKTARILKDTASKNSNNIEALKYRYLEMELYRKRDDLSLSDQVILFFQKWSNRYGTNFIWGIAFTITIAMIFFWLINYIGTDKQIFYLNAQFDFSGFGDIWKKYLDVLNVLNFKDELNGLQLNAWGETLFLLSKIFIAYGMYQTVSAFRKYNKNH